jgi:carbonic anhydrase
MSRGYPLSTRQEALRFIKKEHIMQALVPGLQKFSERIFPKQQDLFETLSQGQMPHTLMITCSDSRIDPNLVTQSKPGEMFVIRNAGNIIPPFGSLRGGEEAAIEFAIEGLGVTNIFICGHSHCGAVAALLKSDSELDSLPSVKNWLHHASATKRRAQELPKGHTLHQVVEENVLVQVDNLRTHPSVSTALRYNRIHIYGWVYNFVKGFVMVYNPAVKRFMLSSELQDALDENASQFAL